MMDKFLGLFISFAPEWTKSIFSPKRRAREEESEDVHFLPFKKQRLSQPEYDFSSGKADPNCQPAPKILGSVKRKIAYNRNENTINITQKFEHKNSKIGYLKYESFKENVHHSRCRSTPVAPLSPAKFKNVYKAPKHIRSPNKTKKIYLKNIVNVSLNNSVRRIPTSIKMSDNEYKINILQPSAESTRQAVNGNRFENMSREDYDRLIGKCKSKNAEVDPVADTPKTEDKGVYEISDDESEPQLVASPPVQPLNSMASKTERTLERTSNMLELVESFNKRRINYAQKLIRWTSHAGDKHVIYDQSASDFLVHRLKDHFKITECGNLILPIIEPLPALTAEMEKRVADAFKLYPFNEVVANKYKYVLTRQQFQCLAKLNWLNDEVINFYMELILMRSKEDKSYPNVHTFGTFFYPRLKSTGPSSVKRWTKKVDLFQCDLILVPIHLHVHWCMACIDLNKKTITFFDSMGSNNMAVLRSLKEYLEYEHKERKNAVLDMSDWSLNQAVNIPQQTNGSDCGVFACQFAEFLSRNAEFTFSQKDMPYFRKKMAWEFIDGKLLT